MTRSSREHGATLAQCTEGLVERQDQAPACSRCPRAAAVHARAPEELCDGCSAGGSRGAEDDVALIVLRVGLET